MINYIILWIIILKLYKHSLSCLVALKEGILKIPGNKQRPSGIIKDNPKDVIVSFNKWICVFL